MRKPPVAKPQPETPTAPMKLPPRDILTPTTIQEARADGAQPGTMISAPLAPATGPIVVGVPQVVRADTGRLAQEPMVVVTVKAFWDSPTIKAARAIIFSAILAVLAVLFTTFAGVWTSGHSIFEPGVINWRATEVASEIAAGTILATAFFAYLKRRDNNPVQGG